MFVRYTLIVRLKEKRSKQRNSMKEHICGLQHSKLDPYGSRINMNDITCAQSWMYMFQINENTPRAKLYFDSKARVFAERRRHALSKYWWVIHPFSTWRYRTIVLEVGKRRKINAIIFAKQSNACFLDFYGT